MMNYELRRELRGDFLMLSLLAITQERSHRLRQQVGMIFQKAQKHFCYSFNSHQA